MFYTRKGDDGSTQLFGKKEKHSKSNVVFEALGTLDELNSYLGVCRVEPVKEEKIQVGKNELSYTDIIRTVQDTLFVLQAEIAGADKHIDNSKTEFLEEVIATIEKIIPPLEHFVIPGSTLFSAKMDYARTLVRRAERYVVTVYEAGDSHTSSDTLAYLNRLSSLFFALARYDEYTKGISPEAPSYL